MSKDIVIVGGSKGGVGKSMVCAGVIDTLRGQGETPLLIESDTSNPDVYKMYKDEVQTETIDLDLADGWIDFVNACDAHPDCTVVVNTAARNNRGVSAHAQTLHNALAELDRRLVTLWVINRQRDSLELLGDYLEAMHGSVLHVVRNGHYGELHKFDLYNNSNLRKRIEEAGGASLLYPDLADRVSDDLYSKRLSIDAALKVLPLGNRAELTRWRGEVRAVLGGALYA